MWQIVTNGAYRSIEHRATVNSKKERLSVASFHSPRFDGKVCPAPSLVTEQTPALFKEVPVKEYFKGLFSRELVGKSYLDTLRIQDGQA
jgi:isopenicillin N synthase-like dioxygenase